MLLLLFFFSTTSSVDVVIVAAAGGVDFVAVTVVFTVAAVVAIHIETVVPQITDMVTSILPYTLYTTM